MWRRWGWPILVAALALLGVLLAVADTALYGPKFGPYATFVIGPAATFLLAVGAVALLRFTLIFLAVIPAVFIIALAAALFGLACIGLAIGRLLQRRLRLGPAHPLVAAVAGTLVVFDLAVIPYV